MSHVVTDTGAFYAYVTRGLGKSVGVGGAGLALLAYTTIQAAIYGLAAATVQDLVVSYGGPDLPWWVWAFGLMAIVGVLGYRSIDLGAKVLGVLLVLEIGVIVALSVAVFAHGGAHGIDATSFMPIDVLRRLAWHRADVRHRVVRRLRGHRDLRRGGQEPEAYRPYRDVRRRHHHRRALCRLKLGRRAGVRQRQRRRRRERGHRRPRLHRAATTSARLPPTPWPSCL